jgi:hypothetical protein
MNTDFDIYEMCMKNVNLSIAFWTYLFWGIDIRAN